MKRVFCIGEENRGENLPRVKKGKIYTVTHIHEEKYSIPWYYLAEMPRGWVFRSDLFADIIEDQQDETCFVRDYNKETV